jgi:hypothetical protein
MTDEASRPGVGGGLFEAVRHAVASAIRFIFLWPRTLMDEIARLRIARQQSFCIAIPFPALDWSLPPAIRESLMELHDYAEQMDNSALDWYLEKRTAKKRRAKVLHGTTYLVAILAAAIPLINLSNLFPARSLTAEASLALVGVAAGLALIDKSAGYTADWMRYVTTASQINRALLEFHFAWDRLESTLPYPPPSPESPANLSKATPPAPERRSRRGTTEQSPVEARIDLVKDFCLKIADVMQLETSTWATDLKERVALLDRQLPRGGR